MAVSTGQGRLGLRVHRVEIGIRPADAELRPDPHVAVDLCTARPDFGDVLVEKQEPIELDVECGIDLLRREDAGELGRTRDEPEIHRLDQILDFVVKEIDANAPPAWQARVHPDLPRSRSFRLEQRVADDLIEIRGIQEAVIELPDVRGAEPSPVGCTSRQLIAEAADRRKFRRPGAAELRVHVVAEARCNRETAENIEVVLAPDDSGVDRIAAGIADAIRTAILVVNPLDAAAELMVLRQETTERGVRLVEIFGERARVEQRT
jgi:hypothetical protein